MKRISVEISSELDKQVRVVAAQLDMNRSEFTRQALEEKLARLAEAGVSDLVAGSVMEAAGANKASQPEI